MGRGLERSRSLYAIPTRRLVGSPFLTSTLPPRSKTQTEVRTNGKAKQAVCDQGWGKPCMNRRHKGTD